MPCELKEAGAIYRPRQPQQTPFYQLVERFYPEFEALYPERYQERYGFWRPVIGTVVRKFLASLSTASPACAVLSAAKSSSWRTPAAAGVCAPRATRNGRWRRPAG